MRSHRLSKSRYLAGLQCHRQLWWRVHEPDALELTPDPAQQARLEEGLQIGELAREYVPGGMFIGGPSWAYEDRAEETRAAIAAGAPVIYEAGFLTGDVFVAVDILERHGEAWRLIEVKSTTSVKDEHLPDLAVQVYTAQAAGIEITSAELMHVNRDCRHPDLSDLFVRKPLSDHLSEILPRVPSEVGAQLRVLDGSLPEIEVGPHCHNPQPCPFMDRCWPELPPNHVSTLHGVGAKKLPLFLDKGWETIPDIPDGAALNPVQLRQRRAILEGGLVVEGALAAELAPFLGPAVHLDFETVSPAIPRWPGTGPYASVPVQASVHRVDGPRVEHQSFLLASPDDPRPALASFLVEACTHRGPVIVWNAGFERSRLKELAEAVPSLGPDLLAIRDRVIDLMVPVKAAVAHPDFAGSFSLKVVGPVLVPGVGYDDLVIQDGDTASRELMRLVRDWDAIELDAREEMRANLLAYCRRDTEITVRLVERLLELASAQP